MTSDSLAVFGLVGTLLFGVLSIWFYRRSRQFRRLDATWWVTRLQARNHPEIQILFNGREIADLSRLRIVLLNSGTLSVRPKEDFPGRFEGAVVVAAPHDNKTGNRATFLSAAPTAGDLNDCSAGARIVEDGSAVTTFEFLNPGQWIGLEVLYSGPTPEINASLIGGTVRTRQYSGVDWLDLAARELLPLVLVVAATLLARVAAEAIADGGWQANALRWLVMILAAIAAFSMARTISSVWRRWRASSKDGSRHRFLLGREST